MHLSIYTSVCLLSNSSRPMFVAEASPNTQASHTPDIWADILQISSSQFTHWLRSLHFQCMHVQTNCHRQKNSCQIGESLRVQWRQYEVLNGLLFSSPKPWTSSIMVMMLGMRWEKWIFLGDSAQKVLQGILLGKALDCKFELNSVSCNLQTLFSQSPCTSSAHSWTVAFVAGNSAILWISKFETATDSKLNSVNCNLQTLLWHSPSTSSALIVPKLAVH